MKAPSSIQFTSQNQDKILVIYFTENNLKSRRKIRDKNDRVSFRGPFRGILAEFLEASNLNFDPRTFKWKPFKDLSASLMLLFCENRRQKGFDSDLSA